MENTNSKKIIFIGAIFAIIFSLITYQNFSNNIEEIIEEQENRSSKLINNNIEVILENINNFVKNDIEYSIDQAFIAAIMDKNTKKIETISSKILSQLENYYKVNEMYFIPADKNYLLSIKSSNIDNNDINIVKPIEKFSGCFTVVNGKSFYRIDYPIFHKNHYLGLFEIRLDNLQILEFFKKHINAEMAIFIKTNENRDSLMQFNDYVITDTTNNLFIKSALQMENFSLEDNEEIFELNEKSIEIDSFKLNGINDDKILVIFHDVTETYSNIEKTIEEFFIYFIILLLLFLCVSYYIYQKSNKTIIRQYDELVFKNEESKKLLKVKSEFLANMSHEIRTPLNAINGFMDLIEEKNNDSEISKYVNIIQDSSKNLLHIIEDILDLSKIESGKMLISNTDFEVKKEFEIVTYLFNTKLALKNIEFILQIDESVPKFLHSDPLRLKQVISNLLDNAIKFTDEGKKIILTISFDNQYLNVSLEDQGLGISQDRLDEIFKPFTQADNSTTRKYGGTGLGLTISSKLINLLGGKLEVSSIVNQGSRFYFAVPVSIGNEVINNEEKKITFNFQNKTILLVEDNKSNQLFMKVIFKKFNLQYDIANDGIEAIKLFEENQYDIIIMDENMPNMSGIEATKYIRKVELEKNLKHTPIIALTANALEGDKEKFLNSGMDEYLTKPLKQEKLAEALSHYLY